MVTSKVKLIEISTEFITLGQFLKFADLISSGAEAKMYIAEHDILVNDENCKMRGKKLRDGDRIIINNSLVFEITK